MVKYLSAACCPGAEPLDFLGALHGPPDAHLIMVNKIITILYLEDALYMAWRAVKSWTIFASLLADKAVIVRFKPTR